MNSEDGPNRRFERVDLRARVQLTSLDPERDPLTGFPTLWESDELCETLSLGGAFIRTVDPPAKGRRVLLQIQLPGGESVETIGRVAWTRVPLRGAREAGVGVEFVAPDGDVQRALSRFLALARVAGSE
jgi:Tfp pilus assembly protein PilZ